MVSPRIFVPFVLLFFSLSFASTAARGQDSTGWSIDVGGTFSTFQQQVKAEVGDPRGERLVNETEFGFLLIGMYRVHEHIRGGIFFQFDRGNRLAARFDGFDSEGRTKTKNKIGGDYSEIWLGPLLHLEWMNLFVEGGYGMFGTRTDVARSDLLSESGDSTGSFSLHPSIAFLVAAGAGVQISENVDLVLRMEYRLRYYTKRGGEAFRSSIEHGTQNISPFVGISWKF